MTDSSPVKWGILSTARICRRVVPALNSAATVTDSLSCATLLAVGSRNPKTTLAPYFPDSLSVVSYEEVLSNPEVEAVYIPLPNSLHAKWAIEALKHGKHVLVEKPFAMCLSDAKSVAEMAQSRGKIVAEGLMYLHHPQTLAVKQLFSERLGTPLLIRAIFHSPIASGTQGNIRLQKELGGGALFDVGIYPISLVNYLLDGVCPYKVLGQWVKYGEDDVDKITNVQLHYRNCRSSGDEKENVEIVMQMSCSFAMPYQQQVEIYGTNGRLLITRPFTYLDRYDRKVLFTPNVPEAVAEEIHIQRMENNLYQGEFVDMFYAIRDPLYQQHIPLESSLQHIKILEAIKQSAEKGQEVYL